MKRILLIASLVALLGCGYYFRGYFFDSAGDTRAARPAAPAQLVVAGVAEQTPTPFW